MKNLKIQWAIQIFMLLATVAEAVIPNIHSWIPTIVTGSIAVLWGIGTLTYWFSSKHRIAGRKPKSAKQEPKLPQTLDEKDTKHDRTDKIKVTRRKEVNIEIFEAHYSSYNRDKDCFLVMVRLTLKATVVPLQLAWLRLMIAGKAFDSVSAKPKLADKIEYTQQTYELEYEVDAHTFLKGRYADPNTMQQRSNCWGHILANAGGTDWKSKEFEIIFTPN